jgi:hypothetical protein
LRGRWLFADPSDVARVLGLEERVHYEGVVVTNDLAGSPHVAAMGFRLEEGGGMISLRPHVSSRTGRNLLDVMCGTLNVTPPEHIVEAALDLGVLRLDVEAATCVNASSLVEALAVVEFRVESAAKEGVWLRVLCKPVALRYAQAAPRPYSRSAGCLVEAAVHVSRVEPFISMGWIGEARRLLDEASRLVETAARLGGGGVSSALAEALKARISSLRRRIGP